MHNPPGTKVRLAVQLPGNHHGIRFAPPVPSARSAFAPQGAGAEIRENSPKSDAMLIRVSWKDGAGEWEEWRIFVKKVFFATLFTVEAEDPPRDSV